MTWSPVVDDPLGLALGLGQAFGLDQFNLGRDQDLVAKPRGDALLQGGQGSHVLDEVLVLELHLDLDLVHIPHPVEFDQIVLADLGHGHEDGLHLHGIDVDALDDDHVVAASGDAVDAPVHPAAGTGTGQKAGQVPGAVADDGHALAAERGHDQFPEFAVRDRSRSRDSRSRRCRRLPQVHAVLFRALEATPGPFISESRRNVDLHVVDGSSDAWPPRYRARPRPGRSGWQVPGSLPISRNHIGQVQGVGRDDVHGRDVEIHNELDLTHAVAGPGRDGQAAQALGAVVDARRGEQPVAGHVLEDVRGPDCRPCTCTWP